MRSLNLQGVAQISRSVKVDSGNFSGFDVRPKKKMFVCHFLTDPKFWKTWIAFFFFFLKLNFAFLNKIVNLLTIVFFPYMSPPDCLMSLI